MDPFGSRPAALSSRRATLRQDQGQGQRLLRPFRSRRFHRAGDKAAGTLVLLSSPAFITGVLLVNFLSCSSVAITRKTGRAMAPFGS